PTRDFWKDPREISGPRMATAGSSRLSVAPDNAAIVTWDAPVADAAPGVTAVRASVRPASSGVFGLAQDISAPGVSAGPEEVENLSPTDQLGVADVGMSPGSEVTMVADHLFPTGEQVDGAVRPPSGWELPIRLASADAVGGPALAVDARGCSVAAWTLER